MNDYPQEGRDVTITMLRLPNVLARTGLARSTIYLRISQGTFPKPVPLGGRAVGWVESEIDDWLNARLSHCRNSIDFPAGSELVRKEGVASDE